MLPHHFRDRMIDFEPAMLAVLGVLPREKPVLGGVVLRVASTVDLRTASMSAAKSKSSEMNEISSHSRAPEWTPRRASTFAG